MTNETADALRQLAAALAANPNDARELQVYGQLPMHLADALSDLELDDEVA